MTVHTINWYSSTSITIPQGDEVVIESLKENSETADYYYFSGMEYGQTSTEVSSRSYPKVCGKLTSGSDWTYILRYHTKSTQYPSYWISGTKSGTTIVANTIGSFKHYFYRAYCKQTSLTSNVYLSSGPQESKTITINVVSPSNCSANVSGTWYAGKMYINDNGTWKEGKPYVNVNGTWKEGL